MDPIDLTTLESVKTYLGIELSDTSMDAVLEQLITAASRFAMTYCSRNFKQAVYTEQYSGQDNDSIVLRESPVTAVASVSVDGTSMSASTDPRVPGFVFDDIAVYARGCYNRFTRGTLNITVTYTAGYATVPQDLENAVNELVGLKYKRRDNLDVASRGIAGETISYVTGDMSRPVKRVFDNYQKAWPL